MWSWRSVAQRFEHPRPASARTSARRFLNCDGAGDGMEGDLFQ